MTSLTKFLAITTSLITTVIAAPSIDAVYFAQSHVQKAGDAYPTLVSSRNTLIKVHVVDPGTPGSPVVTATLNLDGSTQNLTLTGPTTLPAYIPDGPGLVEHNFSDSFTATIPAAWIKPGLTIDLTAGSATTSITNLDIGAPNKVIMTMTDIHYFELNPGDYPAGWDTELESKWPVSELDVRRADDVVFRELVIPPRAGAPAARVTSPQDYLNQTGVSFDGENSAATAWNVALRRAAGRTVGYSLYYLNKYNVSNEGVAGGFSGVGTGYSYSRGILHHELGHALSLPHWGDNGAYPYKRAMFGINPPAIYNETHAGPTWAFDPPSRTFLPSTVQADNVGGNPVGTYKADPMQGGGTGFEEPPFLLNHFSDYSVNRMRDYLEGVVVVWNENMGSYAKWNSATNDYTTLLSNDGVKYPLLRDQSVISVIAAVSGPTPGANMVYPPIGPYTTGLIRLFDPSNATDRNDAQSIFAPAGGCDACLRITQGGMVKTYMIAASYDEAGDPLNASTLITEGVNLPAADGEITRVELLLTPDAEINGLPAEPRVLYTWTPAAAPTPTPASFAVVPAAIDATSINMTAIIGNGDSDFNGGIEYLFTETTGNSGGSDSGWQSSTVYTDTDLQPGTEYRYTVTIRSGVSKATGVASEEFSATTNPTDATETILTSGGADSWNTGSWTAGIPSATIDGRIAESVAAEITTAPLNWSGKLTLDSGSSLRINSGGSGLLANINSLVLKNATIFNTFGVSGNVTGSTWVFPPVTLIGGGATDDFNTSDPRLDFFSFDGAITGTGGFSTHGRGLTTYNFNTTNPFTGGLVINSYGRHTITLNAIGAAGNGDVTVLKATGTDESGVLKLGADHVFSPSATLRLNGKGWNNITNYEYRNTTIILDMNSFNATIAELFIDGIAQPPGGYTGTTADWIDGGGILTVTGVLNDFANWISGYNDLNGLAGFGDDADGDSIANGVENYLGTHPGDFSPGITAGALSGNEFIFQHPINASPADDITATYRWSEDLVTWHLDGADNGEGMSVSFSQGAPINNVISVTATISGPVPDDLFISLQIEQTP